MKLTIKSKQDYGTHVEEYNEVFECEKKELGESTVLDFENGSILISEKKIVYIRGENKMEIEEGMTTECDFNTERGMIVLDVEGLQVEKMNNKVGTIAKAKYKILIVGVEPYTNEIEIVIE